MQAVSQPAMIGSPIGRRTIGLASFGFGRCHDASPFRELASRNVAETLVSLTMLYERERVTVEQRNVPAKFYLRI